MPLIEITNVSPQKIAATKKHTNRQGIPSAISAGFGSLLHALESEGVAVSGPPLVIYHSVIGAETEGDIEICLPVPTDISGNNEIYGRELEGGTVAILVHQGPYHELAEAYRSLTAWISEHGHSIAGPPREIYLNDPQTVAPGEVLTRIEFPVVVGRS